MHRAKTPPGAVLISATSFNPATTPFNSTPEAAVANTSVLPAFGAGGGAAAHSASAVAKASKTSGLTSTPRPTSPSPAAAAVAANASQSAMPPRVGVVPDELTEGLNYGQGKLMRFLVTKASSVIVTGPPGAGKSKVAGRYAAWMAEKGTAVLYLQAIRLNLPKHVSGDKWIHGTTVQRLIGTNSNTGLGNKVRTAAARLPIDTLGARQHLLVMVDECFMLFKEQADCMVSAIGHVCMQLPQIKSVRWIYMGDPFQNKPVGDPGATIVESMHWVLGVQVGAKMKKMPMMTLWENERCKVPWALDLWTKMRSPTGKNTTRTIERKMTDLAHDTMTVHGYHFGVTSVKDPFNTVVITHTRKQCVHWSKLATESAVRLGRRGICVSPCPAVALKSGSGRPEPGKVLPPDMYASVLTYVFVGAECRLTANVSDDKGRPIADNGDTVFVLVLPQQETALAGRVNLFDLATESLKTPMRIRVAKSGEIIDLTPTLDEYRGVHMYKYPITWARTVLGSQGMTIMPRNEHDPNRPYMTAIYDCIKTPERQVMMVAMSRLHGDFFANKVAKKHRTTAPGPTLLVVNYAMNPWSQLPTSRGRPADEKFKNIVLACEAAGAKRAAKAGARISAAAPPPSA